MLKTTNCCCTITDSKEDYSDLLLSEKSPLNIPLDDLLPGCSQDQTEFTSDEDDIMSYHPPVKPSGEPEETAKQQRDGEDRKRKTEENLYSLEAKRKRTEESMKKLQVHLQNKTCPKSLPYSAQANIPPDEQFKKDILVVKQKAEQGFISALTRFNYCRLEKQKLSSVKNKEKLSVKALLKEAPANPKKNHYRWTSV